MNKTWLVPSGKTRLEKRPTGCSAVYWKAKAILNNTRQERRKLQELVQLRTALGGAKNLLQ